MTDTYDPICGRCRESRSRHDLNRDCTFQDIPTRDVMIEWLMESHPLKWLELTLEWQRVHGHVER